MNKITHFFRTHTLLIVILGVSIVVRFFFAALPPFKSDMDSFISWSDHVYRVGFSQFYSGDIWTDYAPGYFYFLWVIAFLKTYIFSQSSPETVMFLYKFVPMICDIITGYLIYVSILSFTPSFHRKHIVIGASIALLYLISPFTVLNSSVWGQVDSVFVVFLALSFYFIVREKFQYAVVAYVFACVIKPQAGIIAPAYLLLLLSPFTSQRFFTAFLTGAVSFFVFTFPFFGINSVTSLASIMSSSVNTYPYGSINTFNLWGVYGFWKSDVTPFVFGMTQQQFGTVLCGILALIGGIYTLLIMRQTSHTNRVVYFTAYCAYLIMAGIMVLTRMHERYLYPFFLYATLFVGLYLIITDHVQSHIYRAMRAYIFFIHILLYVLLNVIHFFNLYYVYIYYYYFLYFKTEVPSEHVLFHSIAQSIDIWSYIQLFSAFVFVIVLGYSVHLVRKVSHGKITA